MNQRKLNSLYGLKWNPFVPDIPVDALIMSPKINHFIWKVENLVMDGGFALVAGSPGLGKSVAMRLLQEKISIVGEIAVVEFTRPQSKVADFYRELGELFGVELRMSNRFGGFQRLRDKWKEHIGKTLFRPVILMDEAQEMNVEVLSELRLLSGTKFDSKIIITVVLAGDDRLIDKLQAPELAPLTSRMRAKLLLESYGSEELVSLLKESLNRAGNPQLMTNDLINTIAEHAGGNPRSMMIMGNDLLLEAAQNDIRQLTEDLYLKHYLTPPAKRKKK